MYPSHAGAAAALLKRCGGRRRLAVRCFEFLTAPLVWLSRRDISRNLDDIKRILVFEPGSLGDVVMLMPALTSLRRRFPKARLSLLCRSGAKKSGYAAINQSSIEALLLEQGLVDDLIPLTVPWLAHVLPWRKYNPFGFDWPKFVWQLWKLRVHKFDLALTGGRSDIRHNVALWLTGSRRRLGYGYAGGAEFLTDVVTPDMDRPHQSELSLQLLEHLDPATRETDWQLRLSSDVYEFSESFLRENGIRPGDVIVGVHPGSRVPTRQWSQERFAEVARRLARQFGAKVIWFGEPHHSANAPDEKNVVPAAFPLREFLAVLSRCQFLVCNESGPMHLAAALGVPSVAIFGSGFPEWFRPQGSRNRIVIRRDVPCRPCNDRCIWKQPYCLRLITVEQVMAAVEEILALVGRSPGVGR